VLPISLYGVSDRQLLDFLRWAAPLGELRGTGVFSDGILIGVYGLHTRSLTLAYHYIVH
jgi:hypothetical protein